MMTSFNSPLKSNGIKRIILILLVTVLILGPVSAVGGSRAFAYSGTEGYDGGYFDYDSAEYMLDLVNQERAAYGLSPLEMDYGMLEAAMTRAYECTYYFSHSRPDGGDASSLNGKIYSENISWGRDAESTMSGWMDSFAHRDNILDPGYESIGIGLYVTSDGRPYWVQVFSYESADRMGWYQDDYGFSYYSYGDLLTSQWFQDEGEWYYLKDDGYMAADEWVRDNTGWMWVDSSGRIVKSQWIQYEDEWYYLKDDGYMAADQWVKDSKGWIWVDSLGKIVKAQWLKDGDNWYYLKSDGHLAEGFQTPDIEQYKYEDAGERISNRNIRYSA